jgi:hypothetical protein
MSICGVHVLFTVNRLGLRLAGAVAFCALGRGSVEPSLVGVAVALFVPPNLEGGGGSGSF